MKITDTEVIAQRNEAWDCLQDGLLTIVNQGAKVVEMYVMRGGDDSQGWEHYQINLHGLIERESEYDTLDICDMSQVPDNLHKFYRVELTEYYDSQAQAYNRYMQLMIEHNGF